MEINSVVKDSFNDFYADFRIATGWATTGKKYRFEEFTSDGRQPKIKAYKALKYLRQYCEENPNNTEAKEFLNNLTSVIADLCEKPFFPGSMLNDLINPLYLKYEDELESD